MGIMVLGDPMLTLSPGAKRSLSAARIPRLSEEQRDALRRTMMDNSRRARLGTFSDYKASHPQFFE
jgi:hypothetical protein